MHGRDDVRSHGRLDQLPALTGHADIPSQQRLCGGRTQADKNLRTHESELGVEPRAASLNFRVSRFLVNAALATLGERPFEMLYDIGDVNLVSVDARFMQSFVKNFPRWTDERMSGSVFLISGLLANEHNRRFLAAFP